ncbi:MAG: hypothetical protein QMD92_02255 [bacterium]|nr:hypothetical protein [bacterium]
MKNTIIFFMIFIAGCKGCNHEKNTLDFKEKTVSFSEKIRLLKKSVPAKERIKESATSNIKKEILVSEINIFFDTSIPRVEISPSRKEGCCKYDFIYKESKEDELLKLIRGRITFNYIWKETLKRWVEVKHEVKIKNPKDMGSIKGRIVNGVTKDPVVEAIVYGEERTQIPYEYTLICRTNNDGYFLINHVSIGRYYVYGTKEGFIKNLIVNVAVEKDKTIDIGTIYLLSQKTTKAVNIKGRVIDKSGNLIKEATIYMESIPKKEDLPITATSSIGKYTLSFASPGKYKVIAQKENISNFIYLTITKKEVEEKQAIEAEDILVLILFIR